MRFVTRRLAPLAMSCLLGVSSVASPAFAAEFNDAQRGEIVDTIRSYLLANPEFLREVIAALEAKDQSQQMGQAKEAIKENASLIFRSKTDMVAGNPEGDVTVVEFFDYNCGYCKRSLPDVNALLDKDKQVRLVLKEFPILGPGSIFASKAALAARKQEKYLELHNAMMEHKGTLDEAGVLAMSEKLGLDIAKLKADMEAPEVQAQIDESYKLAQALGIQGTPAFIIGDRFIPGAVGIDTLSELVTDVRKDGSCSIC
ncbi:protein-disulfide isomerase [Rhodoligotrophos appendicifer]|uniref:DsbA family protein n=1 Tax=Rhodoligotrophos appendicifer TaxID=987056 RepID=UPI0014797F8E|nr:DsbA family protein [Rhodoligotrophos appendicifer]